MQPLKRKSQPGRPDPAPSRWSYRMQRMMLTPGFRLFLRAGLPFLLTFTVATAWLSDQGRRDQLNLAIADMRNQIETRPEFMVTAMAVEGASADTDADIREIVPVDLPITSFDLDLEAILGTVRELPAVRDARVRIRSGGVLEITVTERVPVLLWRTAEGLELVDDSGVVIGPLAARADRADLPLVAGEGADRAVIEALEIFRAAGPLGQRLRGLVRMGERRWDMVLDRGQRIQLPESRPVQALERVIALHQAQDILERDLSTIDMRLASRPTIRMGAVAADSWWQARGKALGD